MAYDAHFNLLMGSDWEATSTNHPINVSTGVESEYCIVVSLSAGDFYFALNNGSTRYQAASSDNRTLTIGGDAITNNSYNGDMDKSYHVNVTVAGDYKIIVNESASEWFPTVRIEESAEPTDKYVYFVNSSEWENVYCYAYTGTSSNNGAWPGVAMTPVTIDGVAMYEWHTTATFANVIFNNNAGAQTEDLVWNTDKCYFDGKWYELNAVPNVHYSLYVKDNSEWAFLDVYAWGASEIFGSWHGLNVREAERVADGEFEDYYVIDMFGHQGATYHLIFNNGQAEPNNVQLADVDIVFNGDKAIAVSTDATEVIAVPTSCTKALVRNAANTNYQSLCVPFDATLSNAKAYQIASSEITSDFVTLVEKTNLEAGHSYIIKPEDAGKVVIKKVAEGAEVTEPVNDAIHFGILAAEADVYPNTNPEYPNIYILSNNELCLLTGSATAKVAPTHAFFKLSVPAGAPVLRIVEVAENATNIESLDASENAVKFIKNGQLFIQKNGVVYNAVGAVVE